jgi:hypothetical protein
MVRQTRPTTVVNHAPRFSMADASVRLSRSQASCTASSPGDERGCDTGVPNPVDLVTFRAADRSYR